MKKYNVYKNDLKFRKFQDIDLNKANFFNDETKKLYHMDLDTITYRLEEFKDNEGILDLKFLNLKELPLLPEYIKKKVTVLIVSNNDIAELSDLSSYSNLKILDCSHNKLSKLPIFPEKIIELSCGFNKLETIDSLLKCTNLEKLDCEGNILTTLPSFNKLHILYCHRNNLTHIPHMNRLKKIVCHTNKITSISSLPSIVYIDCRNNLVPNIDIYLTLQELFINNNPIDKIPQCPELILFECINTNIRTIIFLPKLKEIICDYNNDINIDNKYKLVDENITIHKNKYLIIKTNLY